jgi:hypothetical protein
LTTLLLQVAVLVAVIIVLAHQAVAVVPVVCVQQLQQLVVLEV